MNDDSAKKASQGGPTFAQQVGAKAARKLKARRNSTQGVWLGLGMMGLVGWSVVVPTLLGAALGIWLDKHHPGEACLDAGAPGGRARDRLSERVALGGKGRPRDTRRTGG